MSINQYPSPNVPEIEKTSGPTQKQFSVINRSEDVHFNIELQVFFEGLDEQFEMVELILIDKPNKADSSNQVRQPSLEGLREELARVAPTRVIVVKNGFCQLTNPEKDQRNFLYASIPELKSKGTKRFAVALWTIRDDKPETLNKLKISPVVWSFDQSPFIAVSETSPSTSRITLTTKEEVDFFYMHLPMRRPAVFQYQGSPVEVFLDAKKHTWFRTDQVCWILKIQNVPKALEGLKNNEKITIKFGPGPNGEDPFEILIVPGKKLEHLAKMSEKPIAEPFLVWVSRTVTVEKALEKAPKGKPMGFKKEKVR